MACVYTHASTPSGLRDVICYNCDDNTHFLSNCFPSNFQLNEQTWPTVLHYFIARKFGLNDMHLKKIFTMGFTKDVHMYSTDERNSIDIISNWDLVKKSIMKKALRAKFEQNIVLKQKLLDTADADIVEVSVDDTYWSQLADGTGGNKMGELLCLTRSTFRPNSLSTGYTQIYTTSLTQSNLPATADPAIGSGIHTQLSQMNISSHTPTYHVTNSVPIVTAGKLVYSPIGRMCTSPDTRCIKFYSPFQGSEYKEFSLFSVHPFLLDGKFWSSVQHYFQAQKYETGICQNLVDKIRTASSPSEAYELGTDRRNFHLMVENWDSLREGVMLKALRAKFTDTTLKRILLDTGDRHLVHDSKEKFWGAGKDGKGLNRVGVFLMTIREDLTCT